MTHGHGGARSGAGRPKGAQNKLTKDKKATLQDLAGSYTEVALETLAGIMQDMTAPANARVSAANSLLDRGHGKPAQSLFVPDGDDEESHVLTFNIDVRKPVKDVRVTKPK